MALVKCKECDKEVSSEASSCPHCGFKKKKTGCLGVIGYLFLGLILIAIIGRFSVEWDKAKSSATSTTPIPGVTGNQSSLESADEDTRKHRLTQILKEYKSKAKSSTTSTIPIPGVAFDNGNQGVLESADEDTRRDLLTHILKEIGDDCKVNRTFLQGVVKDNGDGLWSVGCSNGRSYGLLIKNDEDRTVKSLDCDISKALNTPCFVKY